MTAATSMRGAAHFPGENASESMERASDLAPTARITSDHHELNESVNPLRGAMARKSAGYLWGSLQSVTGSQCCARLRLCPTSEYESPFGVRGLPEVCLPSCDQSSSYASANVTLSW